MAYPIVYESDYVAQRSRGKTFFRLLLVIPVAVVTIVYELLLFFAVVAAWFALLLTGRWPSGLYTFVAGVTHYVNRVNAYCYLLTDVYPPFDLGEHAEYPVRLRIAPPKESYSRVKVLFRIVLLIPVELIAYGLTLVAEIAALLAWFAIVVTGRQPEGLQKGIDLGVAYIARSHAYFALLTEDWPPFSPGGDDPLGPASP